MVARSAASRSGPVVGLSDGLDKNKADHDCDGRHVDDAAGLVGKAIAEACGRGLGDSSMDRCDRTYHLVCTIWATCMLMSLPMSLCTWQCPCLHTHKYYPLPRHVPMSIPKDKLTLASALFHTIARSIVYTPVPSLHAPVCTHASAAVCMCVCRCCRFWRQSLTRDLSSSFKC